MLRLYPIGTGYRVTDADAGRLVKALRVPLPRIGYEVQVVLPDGGLAWLSRTPMRTSAYGFKAPKRVVFVTQVPRAPNGKADYKAAKQHALDATA